MKRTLSLILALALVQAAPAQDKRVIRLPAGTYETYFYGFDYNRNKWLRGDIILLDAGRYRMSSGSGVGQYSFDAAKQRVFFRAGPLKDVRARTAPSLEQPAIVLPKKENRERKLAVSDLWAYRKR